MNHRLFIIAVLVQALIATGANAQVCRRNSTPESTPASHFNISGTNLEIAQDTTTRLEWQRCPYGQTLTKNTEGAPYCAGSPRALSWQNALALVNDATLASAGWRLPNIKELVSIIDVQCFDPPFNIAVFPAAWSTSLNPSAIPVGYWTSTPGIVYSGNDVNLAQVRAWAVSLSDGSAKRLPVDRLLFLLLVRNMP